jgi:glycosyltransferase involved in cell wall biosynthesis
VKLAHLRQALTDRPDDTELLHAYFNEAVAAGDLERTRGFFDQLQQKQPSNHWIRRLSIALCLEQKDYPAAMDAVETLLAFSTPDEALIDSALAVRAYLGPRLIDRRSTAETSISLCMIVKNEQAFLGPCLNSIKRLADEIIVVDTGSSDRSADIARVYGAQVFHVQWQDDFSLARNVSLEKAHGDWILILDADEVVAPQDFEALRQMVLSDDENPRAYSLQTRNYLNLANAMDWRPNDRSYPKHETGIGWFPTNKVRLFPRHANIRFCYPVHELVDPSIQATGLTIAPCSIPIHHYGHINETKNAKKAEHYFKLGYTKLKQIGNDKVALRELAVQAGQLARWPEAIELWNRFLAICPGYGEAYANIAGAYWQMGHYDEGAAFSEKAIQADQDLKEGHYNLAINLLLKGEPQKAANILQNILQKNRNYLAAYFMLAAALTIMGDTKKSRLIFNMLEKDLSGSVLMMAIEDLAKKLVGGGFAHYVELLEKASGLGK